MQGTSTEQMPAARIPSRQGPISAPCPAPCPGGTETIQNGNDICSMGPDYPGGSRFPRVGGDRPSTHACSRTSQGVAQPFRLGVDRYRRSRESAFMHCPEGNCMKALSGFFIRSAAKKGPRGQGDLKSGNDEKNRMAQMEDGHQLGQGSGRAAGRRAHNRAIERRAWENRASSVSDGRAVPVDGVRDLHHQDWQAGGSPRRTVVIHREFYRTSTLALDTLVVYEQEREDTQTQQQQGASSNVTPSQIIIGLGEAENHHARVRHDCDSKSGNEMV